MININFSAFNFIFKCTYQIQLIIDSFVIYKANNVSNPKEAELFLLKQAILDFLAQFFSYIRIVDGTLLVMDTVLRFSSAKFCQLFIFSLRVQVFLHNLFFDHLLECLKYHVLLSHTILILIFILSSPCFVLLI
jgi:hypothetical protein